MFWVERLLTHRLPPDLAHLIAEAVGAPNRRVECSFCEEAVLVDQDCVAIHGDTAFRWEVPRVDQLLVVTDATRLFALPRVAEAPKGEVLRLTGSKGVARSGACPRYVMVGDDLVFDNVPPRLCQKKPFTRIASSVICDSCRTWLLQLT